jgi:O-antigen ligase
VSRESRSGVGSSPFAFRQPRAFSLRALKDPGAAAWLALAVLFVFSLPHVIALRNLLLLMLAVVVFRELRGVRLLAGDPSLRLAASAFVLLLLWMGCVVLFVSESPWESLRAFAGEWGRASIVLILGGGVTLALRRKKQSDFTSAVVLVIFGAGTLHMLGHDLAALLHWVRFGNLPAHFSGISDHKANATYVFALLLPVLAAEAYARHACHRSLLGLPLVLSAIALALGVFALITASATNGWIVAVSLALLALGFTLAERDRSNPLHMTRVRILVALCTAFVAVAVVAIVTDRRYEGFVETVKIGWDTESNRQWLDAEKTRVFPLRSNGQPVDPSTYSRIAWAKEGMRLLLEHPLGVEIGKHTFQRLLERKYGAADLSHSHVGLIDLGLNAGFPGIALWLAFLVALGWQGIATLRKSRHAVGLALFLTVVGFAIRMLVDGTLRDHILEQFMFCVGMLAAACALSRSEDSVATV